ncbi:MAG TPA: hypothetical protein VMU59_15265 [Caulobacteraceae bacterium]|nr:hypothetical protein [Caulobacteraceae bacterium]
MDFLRNPKVVLSLGGAVAVLLGGGIAFAIMSRDHGSTAPPPASRGGLVVEMGASDEEAMDPARPLRCFVGGQFVGMMTLSDCAQKNGVATRALDVGVDSTGALAAASDTGPVIQPMTASQAQATPVEPPPPAPVDADQAPSQPTAAGAATAICWRRDTDWRKLPAEMSLNACVQALFAGKCETPGQAIYGRWGDETLRLVPKQVEVSADNRTFRPLAEQGGACAIAPIG